MWNFDLCELIFLEVVAIEFLEFLPFFSFFIIVDTDSFDAIVMDVIIVHFLYYFL